MRTLKKILVILIFTLTLLGEPISVQAPQPNNDVAVVSVLPDTDPGAQTSHPDCRDWRINPEGWPCER